MSAPSHRAIYTSPTLDGSMNSRKAWRSGESIDKEKQGNKVTCGSHIKEYNSETSLHGPKYITEDGNVPIERGIWCLVVLAALIFGVYLVARIITNWYSNPIINTIADQHHPISSLEFPAVTICPVAKAIPKKVVNEACEMKLHEKIYGNDTINHVLTQVLNGIIGEDAEQVNTSHYGFTSAKIVTLLKKVTPICKEYLFNCRWNGKWTPCEDLFRVVSTDDGYCCTFNSAPPKLQLSSVGSASSESVADDFEYYDEDYEYDTPNDGNCPNYNSNPLAATYEVPKTEINNIWDDKCTQYWDAKQQATTLAPGATTPKKKEKKKVVVQKALGPGSNLGLRFEVDMMTCAYLKKDFEGFKFYIHNPRAFPEVGSRGMAGGPRTENFVTVSASVTETTEETRQFSNETRDCNFQEERKLQYYTEYSKSNCELERKIKIYEDMCKCVPYYLPGNHTACGYDGYDCLLYNITVQEAINNGNASSAECPPACSETKYTASVTAVPYLKSTQTGSSIMRVFFTENSIVKYKRDRLYSPEDIISNIGGSLGLCLGFSLISGIELIYFATCRYCLRKSRG